MLVSQIFLVNIILFIVGLCLLIKGCDWFVEAAAFIARRYNVSEIVIGLTLVSIGTSIPELATNVYAAIVGEGALALGNVVGSNITNITLVLGTGVILTGIMPVTEQVLKRDAFFMVGASILLFIFPVLGPVKDTIGRADGVVFLLISGGYIWLLFRRTKVGDSEKAKGQTDTGEQKTAKEESAPEFKSLLSAWCFLVVGLVVITVGAKMMVDNVVWIAEKFRIPRDLIAATIIAFGTSVPELAVTITGIIKKKDAIALGNVIGSCFFNIVMVIGITCVISPIKVSTDMLCVLMPIMIATCFLLVVFMRTSWKLKRAEGYIFLLIYALFIGYNIVEILQK